MILSDNAIMDRMGAGSGLLISPFDPERLQGSSYDLCLSRYIRVFDYRQMSHVDPAEPETAVTRLVTLSEGSFYLLMPGEFVLASTAERVELPADLVARLEGRSSSGRIGLSIHVTAGYVDPGFCGNLTLEMWNALQVPIVLRAGLSVCQISFEQMTGPARRPYGHKASRYQHQGAVPEAARRPLSGKLEQLVRDSVTGGWRGGADIVSG